MNNSDTFRPIRWIIAAAGLFGAAGIAAAAAAAHGSDPRLLGALSVACLANAPALLALGLAGRRLPLSTLSAALLTVGTALFAGDLGSRLLLNTGLFPMAAPTGGTLMILGWLVILVATLLPHSDRN